MLGEDGQGGAQGARRGVEVEDLAGDAVRVIVVDGGAADGEDRVLEVGRVAAPGSTATRT